MNPPVSVALSPLGFVTDTLTDPAAWAGVTAVMVVLFGTLIFEAGAPPTVTVAPDRKFVPDIVTDVPPAVPPLFGAIDVIVGVPLDPPLDSGRIVESFFKPPGGVFR